MYRTLLSFAIVVLVALVAAAAGDVVDVTESMARLAPPGQEKAGLAVSPLVSTGSGFTYQGRLRSGGALANGSYDFEFRLYDAVTLGSQVGATQTVMSQTVADGLFTVQLDFGVAAFLGDARWLEIGVRQAAGGAYTPLSPRQALAAAPYALSMMPGAVMSGTLSIPVVAATNSGSGAGVYGSSSSGIAGYFTGNGPYGVQASTTAVNGTGISGTANNGTAP
jgi:hypothetical protein